MNINKYGLLLTNGKRNVLVKENTYEYFDIDLKDADQISCMMERLFRISDWAEEYVYMIAVTATCGVQGIFEISHGTVNASVLTPREILIRALLVGAVGIILVHNHPSGDPKPSQEDVLVTEKISKASELVNIPLLDHIIIGSKGYYSFHEAGHCIGK